MKSTEEEMVVEREEGGKENRRTGNKEKNVKMMI